MKHAIIKGIVSLGTSSFIQIVFGFVTMMIVARVIPEETLGVYFLLFAMVALLEMAGSFGLRLSAAKFVAAAESDEERRDVVNNVLTFTVLAVAVVSLLAVAGKACLLHFFKSELMASLFFFVPVVFAVQLIENTLSYVMQGYQLYRKMALIQALTGLLNCGLVLLFVLVVKMGVEGYILATVISLTLAAALRYAAIPGPKKLAMDTGLIKRILKFGLPLQGNEVLTFFFQRVDVLLVGMLMDPTHVAYLAVAGRIPDYLKRMYGSFQSVYFPHMSALFSRNAAAEAEEVMNHFVRLSAFVAMFSALLLTLFRREVIVLAFSEKYLPSAPVMAVLLVVASISLVSTILDSAFVSAGRSSFLLIVNAVSAIASVAANVTLIPLIGVMGAALARLISNAAANPLSVWCVRRVNVRVQIGGYLKPALFLGISLGLYWGLGWESIVFRCLLALLFVVLCAWFSIIRAGDLVALSQSLRLLPGQRALKT